MQNLDGGGGIPPPRPYSGENAAPLSKRELCDALEHYDPEAEDHQQIDTQILQSMSAHYFDRESITSLDSLRMRFSDTHPDNEVVQLATQLVGRHLLLQAGRDIRQVVVGNIEPRWIAHLGTEGERASVRHNIGTILSAANRAHEGPIDFVECSRAVKALASLRFDQLDKWTQIQTAAALRHLMAASGSKGQGGDAAIPGKEEFLKGATLMVKLAKPSHIPSELAQYLGYHGNALDVARTAVLEVVRGGGEIDLQAFTLDYCRDQLRPRTFLLRPSSTQISGVLEGAESSVATVSYKNGRGVLANARITHVKERGGDEYWVVGSPPFREGARRHPSLTGLVSNLMRDYLALPAPNRREAMAYGRAYAVRELDSSSSSSSVDLSQSIGVSVDENLKPLPVSVADLLVDSISGQRMTAPVISPSGSVYSADTIGTWIQVDPYEPDSETLCLEQDLRPHLRLRDLLDSMQGGAPVEPGNIGDFREHPILRFFQDPISQDLIQDPVVAPDGELYDRQSITRYLEDNEGQLPNDGGPCEVKDLISDSLSAEILEMCAEKA